MHRMPALIGHTIGATTPAVLDLERGEGGGPVTYVLDTFSGAESGFALGLADHAPDIDVIGEGWKTSGTSFLRTNGVGQARAQFGVSACSYIDSGRGNGVVIRCTVNQGSGSSIVFRFLDVDNHFQCNCDDGQFALFRHMAGDVQQLALVADTITYPAVLIIEIDEDDHIYARLDGQVAIDAVDSFQSDVGNHGIWCRPTDGTFDDFSVSSL